MLTDETLSSLGSSVSGGVVGNEDSDSEDGNELDIGRTEGPSHSEEIPSDSVPSNLDGDNSSKKGSGNSSGGDWCDAEPTADSTHNSAESDIVIVGNSSSGGYNSRPISLMPPLHLIHYTLGDVHYLGIAIHYTIYNAVTLPKILCDVKLSYSEGVPNPLASLL